MILGGYGLKLESVVAYVVGCDFVGCWWVLGDVVVAWRLWTGFLGQLMLGYGFAEWWWVARCEFGEWLLWAVEGFFRF